MNDTHKHAVAYTVSDFGRKIVTIASTHPNEAEARSVAESQNRSFRSANPDALAGYAYARFESGEWLLDGQTPTA